MTNDTRQVIMDVARATVQARGYNALSFREIGKEVGITSASIHYHFPTKADLGAALARAYTEQGATYLALLSDEPDLAVQVDCYVDVFRRALLNDNRMCLCGIMAAEQHDLPESVRQEVDRFTDLNVDWLIKLIGKAAPELSAEQRHHRALAIFAAMEGAQLVARGRGDIGLYDAAIAGYRSAGLLP